MKISSPSRNTSARKPSHLGSKIQSPSSGNSSTRFASIGRIGGFSGRSTPPWYNVASSCDPGSKPCPMDLDYLCRFAANQSLSAPANEKHRLPLCDYGYAALLTGRPEVYIFCLQTGSDDVGQKSSSGKSPLISYKPVSDQQCRSSITDLSTRGQRIRDTTIACSVIQPEAVVRPANRWPRALPTGSRWRHWRLFEQRIRRPRFARGRRYGISG
jgi:hypothetical protein